MPVASFLEEYDFVMLCHRSIMVFQSRAGGLILVFPIWWYTAPAIIRTFLEAYDFTGEKIVLFATSGGSGLGRTAEELADSCPGADIRNGKMLNGNFSESELQKWVKSL